MSETIQAGRVGDYMQVCSGARFYPLDPRIDEIAIEDISGALSRVCRFGGHVCEFYSVAEHAVRVSEICDPDEELFGLLHDGSEAYLGDLIRPLKRQECFSFFREVDHRLQWLILKRFGIHLPLDWAGQLPPSVHRADEILLATEARDLMLNDCMERWSGLQGIVALMERIVPWTPREAEERFLARFRELTEAPR